MESLQSKLHALKHCSELSPHSEQEQKSTQAHLNQEPGEPAHAGPGHPDEVNTKWLLRIEEFLTKFGNDHPSITVAM